MIYLFCNFDRREIFIQSEKRNFALNKDIS